MTRFNQSITVVISAYEAQDFIEECLDSIVKQTFDHRKIEVLLGIDGCKKTLNKVKEIKNKYHTISLKVLWFPENSGVYVTTNTLISIAKHDCILTFGADDIMNPEMIATLMVCTDRYNMIKFRMLNFDNADRSKCSVYHNYAEGCRFFSKKVFMLVGGYMPWRHTGDFNGDLKAVDSNADLALCLDVLFHQVEDRDYFSLLNLIFASNHQYVILYTTIHVGDKVSAHLKQRLVADDIQALYPQWKLLEKLQYNNTEKKYFLLYELS